jgi:hypothetical protein
LRSGTSIGANISEAIRGQSAKDFIHKLQSLELLKILTAIIKTLESKLK